jgi:hypothetical protein
MGRLFLLFSFFCVAPLAGAQTSSSGTDQALLRFYSNEKTLWSGLPGSHGGFLGTVFVDGHLLALLERHRFVTFKVAPGLHSLASNWWMSKHEDNGARLNMNLLADHHYVISTAFKGDAFPGSSSIEMKERTCEDANLANRDMKPLEAKHLRPDGVPIVVTESAFPPC